MPSKKSNHYGTLAEREAAERYDLEFERGYWLDARRPDGTAVEIKATMREHADGQPGNFKIYEKAHRSLRRADGCYVFVVYRIR